MRAEKSLGQNFLLDLNLTGRIARAAGPLEDATVIEVGPGPGGLTRAILNAGAGKLHVIEKDHRCLPALNDIAAAYPGKLNVIEGDALAIDPHRLCDGEFRIIANLPYNVATPLLINWLSNSARIKSMTLMFQKEVADRIVARPRTKAYGRLSILSQWICDVEKAFDISPKAFSPPPKVTSTVVILRPRSKPLYPAKQEILVKIVACAFGQRRKMLRASLKGLDKFSPALFEQTDIPPTARAEELSVEDFCKLARAYAGFQ